LWIELEEIETSQEVEQSTIMIKIWKTQVNGMIISSGNNFLNECLWVTTIE
jgi:hypothetical protein